MEFVHQIEEEDIQIEGDNAVYLGVNCFLVQFNNETKLREEVEKCLSHCSLTLLPVIGYCLHSDLGHCLLYEIPNYPRISSCLGQMTYQTRISLCKMLLKTVSFHNLRGLFFGNISLSSIFYAQNSIIIGKTPFESENTLEAPEFKIENLSKIPEKVDSWLVGSLIFQILTSTALSETHITFSSQEEVNSLINTEFSDNNMRNLLKKLLKPDPLKRARLSELIQLVESLKFPSKEDNTELATNITNKLNYEPIPTGNEKKTEKSVFSDANLIPSESSISVISEKNKQKADDSDLLQPEDETENLFKLPEIKENSPNSLSLVEKNEIFNLLCSDKLSQVSKVHEDISTIFRNITVISPEDEKKRQLDKEEIEFTIELEEAIAEFTKFNSVDNIRRIEHHLLSNEAKLKFISSASESLVNIIYMICSKLADNAEYKKHAVLAEFLVKVTKKNTDNYGIALFIRAKSKKEYTFEYEEALRLFKESFEILSQSNDGAKVELCLTVDFEIANIYEEMGQNEQCISVLEELVRKCTEIFEEPTVLAARALNCIGIALENMNKLKPALERYLQSFTQFKEIFKTEEHKEVAKVLNNMASCYFRFENFEECAKIYTKVASILKTTSVENLSLLGSCYNNLGNCYIMLGNDTQAKYFFGLSVEYLSSFLGEDHPNTLLTRKNLGDLYFGLAEKEEARKIYKEIAESLKNVFGEDSDVFLSVKNRINTYIQYARDTAADT